MILIYIFFQNDSADEKAKLAYKSVLFISYFTPNTIEYKNFTERVKIKSEELFNYTYKANEEVQKYIKWASFPDFVLSNKNKVIN